MPSPRANTAMGRSKPPAVRVPHYRPSLLGTWVTSFISWNAIDPRQILPQFASLITMIDDELLTWDDFDRAWDIYKVDTKNDLAIAIAALTDPAPAATLSSFVFNADGTFYLNGQRNNQYAYETFELTGDYTIDWSSFGVPGGDINIMNPDPPGGVHVVFKFLLQNPNEMKFISAYGPEGEFARLDFPQVAAGTMHRVDFPD